MNELVQGISAYRVSAEQRTAKIHELVAKQFTHFSYHKSKTGVWAVYASHKSGNMYWQSVASHFKVGENAIFLRLTEDGFYGFVIKDGLLEEEWTASTLLDHQIAQAYLSSQNKEASHKFTIYLCDFEQSDELALSVQFVLPDVGKISYVSLRGDETLRLAKLKLLTPKELRKQKTNPFELAMLAILFACICGGSVWAAISLMKPKDIVSKQEKSVDPYAGLKKTLTETGINIKGRMVQLYFNYKQISEIKGWRATSIDMQGNNTAITMERTWGDYAVLKDQAKSLGYDVLMLGGKYQLVQVVQANAVLDDPSKTPPISGTISYLKDSVAYYWPQKLLVREEAGVTNNAWKQVRVVLSCQGIYTQDLDNLASILNGWPVTFEKATFAVGENGVLNGELVIQILSGA